MQVMLVLELFYFKRTTQGLSLLSAIFFKFYSHQECYSKVEKEALGLILALVMYMSLPASPWPTQTIILLFLSAG